jgi:hypothetical protein
VFYEETILVLFKIFLKYEKIKYNMTYYVLYFKYLLCSNVLLSDMDEKFEKK